MDAWLECATRCANQCQSSVGNLSAHVEQLLAADLGQRQSRLEDERQRTERAIDALATLYEAHGSLSEEIGNL